MAVGTSLATIIPTSIISALAHQRKGGFDQGLFKRFAPGVLFGVLIGASLSRYLSGHVLTLLFAIVASVFAVNMVTKEQQFVLGDQLPGATGTSLMGLVTGAVSTLIGIGGGTFTVPFLSAFKTPIHVAVGTAAAIGLVISLPGAMAYVMNGLGVAGRLPFSWGYVNLAALAIIVPMTMLMAPVGVRLAHALDATRLRQVFALFLGLTALRMFYGVFTG